MKSNYLSAINIKEPVKMRLLIDTGAENINIISLKMFEKLKKVDKQITKQKNDDIIIRPLGSKIMKTCGTTKIKLQLKEGLTTELIPFIIAEELHQYDLILGLPAIEQLKINLDVNNGKVKILNEDFKLLTNNFKKTLEIRTTQKEIIPPGK